MLKTILSISGKPGLYKMLSNNKNMLIVESLQDSKKIPVYARDRMVSLGDISIYTEEDEILLKEVLCAIKKKEEGKAASIAPNSKPDDLRAYFAEVLPNYDKERVYPSDMKKIISWYNLLTASNIDFEAEEEPTEEVAEEEK